MNLGKTLRRHRVAHPAVVYWTAPYSQKCIRLSPNIPHSHFFLDTDDLAIADTTWLNRRGSGSNLGGLRATTPTRDALRQSLRSAGSINVTLYTDLVLSTPSSVSFFFPFSPPRNSSLAIFLSFGTPRRISSFLFLYRVGCSTIFYSCFPLSRQHVCFRPAGRSRFEAQFRGYYRANRQAVAGDGDNAHNQSIPPTLRLQARTATSTGTPARFTAPCAQRSGDSSSALSAYVHHFPSGGEMCDRR